MYPDVPTAYVASSSKRRAAQKCMMQFIFVYRSWHDFDKSPKQTLNVGAITAIKRPILLLFMGL